MGELGLNKILGAVLATCLGLFALHELSGIVFGGGGGHGHGDDHAEEMTMTEKFCSKFAYCVEIAETGAVGAVEEVFDLGLALASADVAKGASSFKGKCSTCHTVDVGGPNGTGPNLANIVGATYGANSAFGYSGALSAMDGAWTYESLDSWLKSPSKMVSGTSMSFAGVPRDNERANIIAYLASTTASPPAFPAPLETTASEGEAAEGAEEDGTAETPETEGETTPPAETEAEGAEAPEAGTGEAPTEATETQEEAATSPADAGDLIEDVAEVAEDAATAVADVAEDVTETVAETVEDAVETVEDVVGTDPETPAPTEEN